MQRSSPVGKAIYGALSFARTSSQFWNSCLLVFRGSASATYQPAINKRSHCSSSSQCSSSGQRDSFPVPHELHDVSPSCHHDYVHQCPTYSGIQYCSGKRKNSSLWTARNFDRCCLCYIPDDHSLFQLYNRYPVQSRGSCFGLHSVCMGKFSYGA